MTDLTYPLGYDFVTRLLPHRDSFLLVDKILDIQKEQKFGLFQKNVTIGESFFRGHFPENPIMPGVLLVESAAQAAILYAKIAILNELDNKTSLFLFASIENVYFKKEVRPGDVLKIKINFISKKLNVFVSNAVIYVNDNVVAEIAGLKAFRKVNT